MYLREKASADGSGSWPGFWDQRVMGSNPVSALTASLPLEGE